MPRKRIVNARACFQDFDSLGESILVIQVNVGGASLVPVVDDVGDP